VPSVAAEITGGEVSAYMGYAPLMAADGPPVRVLLADRGYDCDAIRNGIETRGGVSFIPARKSRRIRETVDGHVCALRKPDRAVLRPAEERSARRRPAATRPPQASSASSFSRRSASGSETSQTRPEATASRQNGESAIDFQKGPARRA